MHGILKGSYKELFRTLWDSTGGGEGGEASEILKGFFPDFQGFYKEL